MSGDVQLLYTSLRERAASCAIRTREARLKDEVAGEFDGVTITLSQDYDPTERAFYLAHSIGSIAEWSIHFERSRRLISELRDAKSDRSNEVQLARAVNAYLLFEQRTWEFAVWLLEDTGHRAFLAEFNIFARADLEIMRRFHISGHAPNWRHFYSDWKEQVRTGQLMIEPFASRAIPHFQPVRIPRQEILKVEG